MRADLVVEGGGPRAIALLGAVEEAEGRGVQWVNLAGTSAGAVLAGLLAAGYSASQIRALLMDISFTRFLQSSGLGLVPLIGPTVNLWRHNGIFRAGSLRRWLQETLAEQDVHDFGDLRIDEEPGTPERYRYRLQVITADVQRYRTLVLPQDARRYGLDPDDVSVARAITASAAIPYVYRPQRLTPESEEPLLVDGGLVSNFPVWLFDSEGKPPWPTFGLKLIDPGDDGRPVRGPLDLARALVVTMMVSHDRLHEEHSRVRTIEVPTLGYDTLDFDLTREDRRRLWQQGRESAAAFFDRWDFVAYVRRYRAVDAGRE